MTDSTHAARTLAGGRRTSNILAVCLGVSFATNIAVPIYFWSNSHARDQVVVFDLASGTLLLSPLVDPADSKEILTVCASWAAKSVLDRSPTGLDNEDLISILFDAQTARKVREEFAGVKAQYAAKNLRSHVEIKSIDAQSIGQGIIKARVIGQVIITGVLNEQAIQEKQNVALDLSLARNPDLGRNRRYPLMCFQYEYASDALAKK